MRHRNDDHRVKKLIANSGNPNLFPELDIPRSTACGWIKNGVADVVSISSLDQDTTELVLEIARMRAEIAASNAKETLVFTTIRIFGFQIQYSRLPDPGSNATLINAIHEAAKFLPLGACLCAIGLSAA